MAGETLPPADGLAQEQRPSFEERLQAIGITFRAISDGELTWMQQRDSDSVAAVTNVAREALPIGYKQEGLFVDDHLVGYGLSGAMQAGKQVRANIGMVYVSPDVRGLGLATLLETRMVQQLLALRPNVITMDITDTTGAMFSLAAGQKFGLVQRVQGPNGPILRMDKHVKANVSYQKLLQLAAAQAETRLAKLSEPTITEELHRRALAVDLSNPRWIAQAERVAQDDPGTDIAAVVRRRLEQYTYFNRKTDNDIFGDYTRPVHLWGGFEVTYPDNPQELMGQILEELTYGTRNLPGAYAVELRMHNIPEARVRELLEQRGRIGDFRVDTLPPVPATDDRPEIPPRVAIRRKPITSEEQLQAEAAFLAEVAEALRPKEP